MNTNMVRATGILERYLPAILGAAVVLIGYFWFIQPKVSEYLSLRGDIQTQESRLRVLQEGMARGQKLGPVDEQPGLREFERRVPDSDRVVEAVEHIVRAALNGVPSDQVKNLSVQTGARVQAAQATGGPSVRAPGGSDGSPDPRLSLFGTPLAHTPVTISFESTFQAAGDFVWRLRDMPTIVEIRTVTLTRGLPLMKVSLTAFVYQRTGPTGGTQPGVPTAPEAAQPAAPRVAMMLGTEGW